MMNKVRMIIFLVECRKNNKKQKEMYL